MKITPKIAFPFVALGLMLSMPPAHAAQDSQATLKSEAKITEAEAQATALAKAPNGTMRSVEFEREHGHLIWSFDIARPSVKGVTEVQIDAKSGEILSVKHETAKQEASEAKAETKVTN